MVKISEGAAPIIPATDSPAYCVRQLDQGPGGHLKVFDGRSDTEISGFFASEGFRGVTVAVGDVDGEVIVGTAAAASHVKAFDFATGATLLSFLAFEGFAGGGNVAAGDFDPDGHAEARGRLRAAHWGISLGIVRPSRSPSLPPKAILMSGGDLGFRSREHSAVSA